MSTLAPDLAPASTSPVLVLARLEARRLLKHPVFWVSLLLFAWFLLNATVLEPEPNLHRLSESWAVLTGFFVGLAGFVAMYRLTRSTAPACEVVDAAPVHEVQRTLALCLVCLLPFAVAVLGGVWTWVTWEPGAGTEPGFYDALPRTDIWLFHVTVLLSALGGPLLGVAVGRWWSWPMAGAVTAVALVAWSVSSGVSTTSFVSTLHHLAAPFALPITGASSEQSFQQAGSWWLRVPYVASLCALAMLAALAHGAGDGRRTRLVQALVCTGVVALVLLVLSAATGADGELLWRSS